MEYWIRIFEAIVEFAVLEDPWNIELSTMPLLIKHLGSIRGGDGLLESTIKLKVGYRL